MDTCDCYIRARKKKRKKEEEKKKKGLRYNHPVGKLVIFFPCSAFITLPVLQARLKEQACYIGCPEKCVEELCPKC